MIQIGSNQYPTSRPANLDEAVAATGLTAAEVVEGLSRDPQASHLATALHPFLGKDAPPLAELAVQIAAVEDREPIRQAVVKLYAAADVTVEPKA